MRAAILSADPVFGESLACLLAAIAGAEVTLCLTSIDRAKEAIGSQQPDVLLVTEEFLDPGSRADLEAIKRKTGVRIMLIHIGQVEGQPGHELFDRVQSRWSGVAALVDALRTLAEGARRTGPRGVAVREVQPKDREALSKLLRSVAPREREVAKLVVEGLSNADMGAALGISQPTVKLYVSRLLRVFGCSSRVQLALRLSDVVSASPEPASPEVERAIV